MLFKKQKANRISSIGHFSLSFSMSASALIAPELRTQTEFTLSLLTEVAAGFLFGDLSLP